MADYGITNFVDEDMLYIRQSHCAVSVHVRYEKIFNGYWHVEISNDGEVWTEVFLFSNREDAFNARDKLADFINETAKAKIFGRR